MHDALYSSQANACPRKFGYPVESLKDPEQLVLVAHVESYPIIPNNEYLRVRFETLEGNVGMGFLASEFPCVSQEIFKQDA